MARNAKNKLKAQDAREVLSYIINTTPELKEDIDLPVQGQNLKEIGKLILDCDRHRNAFINTVNLIGKTVITRMFWDDPWLFAESGVLEYGESVRELYVGLTRPHDYNENVDDITRFLKTEVPNVWTYIHEINFQKFYEQTTSDAQIAMAFDSEMGIFDLIDYIISRNWQSMTRDLFQLKKYIIARRIIDGTIPAVEIDMTGENDDQATQILATANTMTFLRPDFNPIGEDMALNFDDMVLIINSKYQAAFDIKTLSTRFHMEKADNKEGLVVLVDSFGYFNMKALEDFIAPGEVYNFTDEELEILDNIPAIIISKDWFKFYKYNLNITGEAPERVTDFYNPTTLRNNHYLHVWGVASSSPYQPCVCFTPNKGEVTALAINPSETTIGVGGELTFSTTATVTGVVNKAVFYEVDNPEVGTINQSGRFKALSAGTVTITATSISDNSVTATATVTVV